MGTVTTSTLVTAEEFLHSPGDDVTELVRGRIVKVNRPYTSHGYYMMQFAFAIQQYLKSNDIGRVAGGDAGVITERNPDTVRGPDVAFYSYKRVPRGPLPNGYWPTAPELVVEIRSPDDRWNSIYEKAAEYLSADVLTVAIADPATQKVHLLTADQDATVFNADDELTFPSILPGFTIRVKQLFE